MKVNVKSVAGGLAFAVECEPSETVAVLKQKIEAANANLPAAGATTIFQGKVLADATTLEAAGVTETGFIVVMARKAAGACPCAARQALGGPDGGQAPLPAAAPSSET